MAASLVWGFDEAIVTSNSATANGSPALPPLQLHPAPAPLVEGSSTPSPNDLSAAAILATLADSRPANSEEDDVEEELEEDDDEIGGIALDVMAVEETVPYDAHAATVPIAFSHIDHVLQTVPAVSGPSFPQHDVLDIHAAAFDALSMEQFPIVAHYGQSMPDFLLSQSSLYDSDFDPATNGSHEEHIRVLNKDAFLPIAPFFRHVVGSGKDHVVGLDVIAPPEVVTREDLRGDECDCQGIDWTLRRTTRAAVRSRRTAFESTRLQPQLVAVRQGMTQTPNTESYFSFRRNNMAHQACIPHFQLRNLLASTSRNDIYYADQDAVLRTNATGTPPSITMNLSREMTEAGRFQITTLSSSDEVLVAGGFEGEYALTTFSDSRGTHPTIGRIHERSRDSKSHITNHIHLFRSRHNYTPQAAFCSNDYRLRILDCHTNTFTHMFSYSQAVNCSATSPNGRMRVVVGDFRETLITNAETGQPFETLRTHTDDVFACDWADDGIHVATAAQDSTIVIWDARNWRRPLKVMCSELSIPRCLRFSPVGGGPRVLVSAEADDYVNIINAQTFESRQVLDFFGRTAGIAMTADGSSLFVANSEPHFGGIMEFERCGWGERRFARPLTNDLDYDDDMSVDWGSEDAMEHDGRVLCGRLERERRGLDLGSLMV